MVHVLSHKNSILTNFLAELRDDRVQKDSMRFRRNLERVGEIMAYELSKTLEYEQHIIQTPLGEVECQLLSEQPVIAGILRAGLPLHQGVLNYFDQAENAFISAYRRHTSAEEFEVEIEYMSSPSLNEKTVIICDPMLASGSSMALTYKALLQRGTPKDIHVMAVIASAEGVEYVKRHMPASTTFWIGAVDSELTAQAYIVPGLGDAGDLAYGPKV